MEQTKQIVSDRVEKYFTNFLGKIGIQHSSVTISEYSGKGNNVVCTIAKAQVKDFHNINKEYHFVIKSASSDKQFRAFIQSSLLFNRELYLYSKVLQEFVAFQREVNIQNPFQSFATYYGSLSEEYHEAIVMEDMTTAGYKLLKPEKPLDYQHALLVIKEYGRFHALSYALRDKKPLTFSEFAKNTQEDFFSDKGWKNLKSSYYITLRRALDNIDPLEQKSVYEKFARFVNHIGESMKKVWKFKATDKYSVILHADCWINNILFKYENIENPNVPTKVCFIDWQFSSVGTPAVDLSYFLFTSTDSNLRKHHYHHLIKEYHNSLSSFYSKLTGNTKTCLPFEMLLEHLQKFSIFGLFMSMQALYIILNKPKEDINMASVVSEGKNILSYESENLTEFNKRVKEVMLDYDKLGYAVD